MKMTISGRIPSKKNSKQWIKRGNRKFLVPSDNHQAWEEDQSWLIKKYIPKTPIEKCTITMKFYAPDRRSADLDNKATSILDLFVKNRIIKDDSWFVVTELRLSFKGVEKENPRAEIEIVVI